MSLMGEALEKMAWLLAFTCLLIPQTEVPPPALVAPPRLLPRGLRGGRTKRRGGGEPSL
jgi:hypothetical protein